MSQYKRCSVVFNLSNPMQRDLYGWCMQESTNFSDFVRTVLYSYKVSKESGVGVPLTVSTPTRGSLSTSDVEAMAGLL